MLVRGSILFKCVLFLMCVFVPEHAYIPISVADTDMLCQGCVSLSSGFVVVIIPFSELMLKNCPTSVYRGIMYLKDQVKHNSNCAIIHWEMSRNEQKYIHFYPNDIGPQVLKEMLN